MGEPAHIVSGVRTEPGASPPNDQLLSMFSAPHGAGRAMSRTAARGKTNRRTGEIITPGRVTREMMNEATAGIELRGGDLDEAPQAYKRLTEVLAHHSNTLVIEHTLRPIGVAMAGRDVVDPFKD
jgi:tRNA-splicing ligase RtcB